MPDYYTPEQTRVLRFLASMPSYGHITVNQKDAHNILLKTDGTMLAHGRLWDIVAKHLGAGVYRLSLKERP